jgi:hypothetical protein
VSYRHSSYRKMSAAMQKANGGEEDLTRPEMDRVLHWENLSSLPKPTGWGRPSRVWERRHSKAQRAPQL